MKKFWIILSFCCIGIVPKGHAQSIAQLTTQLVLDIEKLSTLKSILSDMYKAYTIIDKGYGDVQSIVNGNFNLHKAFLDGLLVVSPNVKSYQRVTDIINAEITILSEYKTASSVFSSSGHFTTAELAHIASVYANIVDKSIECVDRLTMVMTDNQLRMNDAQRLQAIDNIYTDANGDLTYLRNYNDKTSVTAIQRAQEAGDIAALQNLYGLE